MIDQPSGVPWHVSVDVETLGQRENIHCCVTCLDRLRVLGDPTATTLVLVHQFAHILDDLRLLRDETRRINPAPMDLRAAHFAEFTLPPVPQLDELAVQNIMVGRRLFLLR